MQKKTYFTNSKGNKICGIISNPNLDQNAPVIILCHEFTTSKDSSTNIELEQKLNSEKIATLRFDFFGHGESDGDFQNITISEAVDDILNAIKYLKNEGFSKIGLVGSSFGGISSVMTASKTNDLSILVLKSPVSDYLEVETLRKTEKGMKEWEEKGYIIHTNSKGDEKKLLYSFVEDFNNNNAYEAAKKIAIPTLIVHGDADTIVPIQQSKKLVKNIKNGKLEIITGAGHKYIQQSEFEKMIELIYKFITKNI